MPKRDREGIEQNKLHVYHSKIDQTDWRICKCCYCSVWTPEVLKSYEDSLK